MFPCVESWLISLEFLVCIIVYFCPIVKNISASNVNVDEELTTVTLAVVAGETDVL